MLKAFRENRYVRGFLKFSLAITALEVTVLLYFYDVYELVPMYLKLTGLDKYITY